MKGWEQKSLLVPVLIVISRFCLREILLVIAEDILQCQHLDIAVFLEIIGLDLVLASHDTYIPFLILEMVSMKFLQILQCDGINILIYIFSDVVVESLVDGCFVCKQYTFLIDPLCLDIGQDGFFCPYPMTWTAAAYSAGDC